MFLGFLKYKHIQFLIITIILLIFYLLDPIQFWKFNIVPYDDGNGFPESAIKNFFDLRYLQYLSIFYEKLHLPADQFYNFRPVFDIGGATDPTGVVLNYPRLWVIFAKFSNIQNDQVLYSIYFITFLYYSYIFYYLTKKFNSYFFLIFFLSGSSFLLLERGNVDIFMFVILFAALNSNSFYINAIGYIATSFFKIYPSFSLLFFLNQKNFIQKIIILGVIFSIYLFITREDAYYIALHSPKTGDASYGILSIILNIKKHFSINLEYYLMNIIAILILLFLYIFVARKKINKEIFLYENLFLAGSGIYCFTFLINTHHDNRLIFLAFCLPLILNLTNKFQKNALLLSIFISIELQRLIFFLGFFGGLINTSFKLLLFYQLFFIYLNIIERKLLNNNTNFLKIKDFLDKKI